MEEHLHCLEVVNSHRLQSRLLTREEFTDERREVGVACEGFEECRHIEQFDDALLY